MAVARKLNTAEEFEQMPGHENFDLVDVDGELAEHMPTSDEHGEVVTELLTRLRIWSKETGAGRVGTESGFVCAVTRIRCADPTFSLS